MCSDINDSNRYVKNPDVVLREENEDGGLLFNPDTNQVKVVNPTGLFIFNKCDGNRDLTAIINELKESFINVPGNESIKHVKKFLDEMVSSGFIGVLEE